MSSIGDEYASPEKELIARCDHKTTYFHFVLSGKGFFNGQKVGAGDAFVAWADEKHTILSDSEDPFHFVWIGISGFAHQKMLIPMGFDFDDKVFHFDYYDAVAEFTRKVVYTTPVNENATGYLTGETLRLLAHHSPSKIQPAENSGEAYVAVAKQVMSEKGYFISVDEIAKKLGLSRKHLSVLFRKHTKTSVRRYLLVHRMAIARGYLVDGRTPKEVGEMLGYNDYSAFYNAFKHIEGMTPTEYVEKRDGGKKKN